VLFEEQSLSLSLSLSRVEIGMKRGGAQNPQNLRVQFSKNKTNPKLLSEKKGVAIEKQHLRHHIYDVAKNFGTASQSNDDFDDDDDDVDGESRLVRAVFFVLVGEERERGAWKSTSENV